jgi:hypothetical protein
MVHVRINNDHMTEFHANGFEATLQLFWGAPTRTGTRTPTLDGRSVC